jgi:hypothetical protein
MEIYRVFKPVWCIASLTGIHIQYWDLRIIFLFTTGSFCIESCYLLNTVLVCILQAGGLLCVQRRGCCKNEPEDAGQNVLKLLCTVNCRCIIWQFEAPFCRNLELQVAEIWSLKPHKAEHLVFVLWTLCIPTLTIISRNSYVLFFHLKILSFLCNTMWEIRSDGC